MLGFLSQMQRRVWRLAVRGYSLPEMAIALLVLGILLGGIVVPLSSRLKAEARLKTENLIYDAREAVLGYGIANRTVSGVGGIAIQIQDYNGLPHAMPEGRPYLPCPDITGDGVEDRVYGSSSTFEAALLAGIGRTTPPRYIHYFSPSPPTAFATNGFRLGSCQEQKGLLPWRTLGLTEKGDSWGRQLGYWVDLAYSNRLLGFDEFSRADTSDPRRGYVAETVNGRQLLFYSEREADTTGGNAMNMAGGIVCSHLFKTGGTDITAAEVGCPPSRTNQGNLVAGIIHTHNGMVTVGARRIPAYASATTQTDATGIVNGAAFVIFSHGPNGWGGVNAESGKCSSPPPNNDNLAERANAFYATGHPLLATAGANCTAMTHAELSENRFVAAPPSTTGDEKGKTADGGDDIVVWTAPQSLFGAFMQAGALPIPKLDFAPEGR